MANNVTSVGLDQLEPLDLGLQYSLRLICPNIWGKYGAYSKYPKILYTLLSDITKHAYSNIYRKFHLINRKFSDKNPDIFFIFLLKT